LGILPGVIGAIQATEAIKLILGIGEPLIGRLLLYDALTMTLDEVHLRKNPDCPICGESPTLTGLIDYEQFCGVPAHDHSLYLAQEGEAVPQITPGELNARLQQGERLRLLDVRESHEWDISNLGPLGATLMPQREVLERMGELDTATETIVYCRTVVRSANVIRLLQEHGFKKLLNLAGGINRWAREVDVNLPEY
jgi:adenylyltransferase/sulfurtransferase